MLSERDKEGSKDTGSSQSLNYSRSSQSCDTQSPILNNVPVEDTLIIRKYYASELLRLWKTVQQEIKVISQYGSWAMKANKISLSVAEQRKWVIPPQDENHTSEAILGKWAPED